MTLKYTIDHHGYNILVSMETLFHNENWIQLHGLHLENIILKIASETGSQKQEKEKKIHRKSDTWRRRTETEITIVCFKGTQTDWPGYDEKVILERNGK